MNSKSKNNFMIISLVLAVFVILGAFIVVRKYAPSKERMKLNDYFNVSGNEMAVIVDGAFDKPQEGAHQAGRLEDGSVYLNLSFFKTKVDDGYVYDNVEKVLRYTTDKNVVSVNVGEKKYTVDKTSKSFDKEILKDIDGEAYISADWAKNYSDFQYTTQKNPNRVIIENAGWKKKVAAIRKNTYARRFGGLKSKILADVKKNDSVVIIDDYGKWSKVVTSDGVIGCVENSKLKDITDKKTKATLEKREYKHKKAFKKHSIILAWAQVTNQAANSNAMKKLDDLSMVNVISPTWFYIADAKGNVGNRSSREFVNYAHSKGKKVWGLISNFEDASIDTASALNRVSARDNLVDQTIAAAIASGVDGINVDFEQISENEKDGYLEFIKELSLKCKKNDLVLSVDNYVPTAASAHYNRAVQANYADYVVAMAYDEHYAGSKEAGSVSSYPFVRDGIKATLKEVPKEQLVLALPFYTRIWCTEDGTVTSEAVGMNNQYEKFGVKGGDTKWLSKECQNYGEYKSGNKLYQCWFEDSKSLGKKMELVNKENLAGVAFWKLGLESDDAWVTVLNYFAEK